MTHPPHADEFPVTALMTPAPAPLDGCDAPPQRVRLMPLGEMTAVDGRSWRLTDPVAVIKASQIGIDLVIDFDHATEAKGAPAPAAGWITGLDVDDGYLVAAVRWTERGAAALKAQDYRFLSPTFVARKDGTVVRILRAALVNAPAMPQLGALAKTAEQPGDAMSTEIETLTARATAAETQLAAARTALGLAADADLVAAVGRLADAEKTLAATVQQLTADVAGLQQAAAGRERDEIITAAVKDGKLPPALVAWAKELPVDQLRAYVAGAPAIITAGARGDLDRRPATGDDGLTENERVVCQSLQLQPKEFIASRGKEETA